MRIRVDNDHDNEDYPDDDDDKDNYDNNDDKIVNWLQSQKHKKFLDCRLFRKTDQKILGNSGNSSFVAWVFCSKTLQGT